MCLIIVAPKGTDKYSKLILESIDNGAWTNDDGYGYCYKKDNDKQIYISKGYKDVEALKKSIKEKDLKLEDELIIHFRIGTSGKKDDKNCHPFVISESQDEILQLEGFVEKPVLAHNGVFGKYTEHNSDFSDTYHFVKRFASIPEVVTLLERDETIFGDIFSGIIYSNKLAILFPNRDFVKIGDFTEDEGYFFSNSCYKNTHRRNIGGVEHDDIDYYQGWENMRDYRRNNTGFKVLNPKTNKKGGTPNSGSNGSLSSSKGAVLGRPILSEFSITEDNYEEIALMSTKTDNYLTINNEYYIDSFKHDDFNIGLYHKDSPNTITYKSKSYCDESFYIVPRKEFALKYKTFNILSQSCTSTNSIKKLRKLLSRNYHKIICKFKGDLISVSYGFMFVKQEEAKFNSIVVKEQKEVIAD